MLTIFCIFSLIGLHLLWWHCHLWAFPSFCGSQASQSMNVLLLPKRTRIKTPPCVFKMTLYWILKSLKKHHCSGRTEHQDHKRDEKFVKFCVALRFSKKKKSFQSKTCWDVLHSITICVYFNLSFKHHIPRVLHTFRLKCKCLGRWRSLQQRAFANAEHNTNIFVVHAGLVLSFP